MSITSDQKTAKPTGSSENFQAIAVTRRGQLGISALLSVVASILGLAPFVAIYLITVHLIENGLTTADTSYVLQIVGWSLLATVIKALTMGSSLHISHIAAYDILYEARLELARKLGSLPLGFFDRRNTGAIKRVIHENVEKMEIALAHVIPELAAAVTVPIASLIALFFVDWRLALILLLSPILGVVCFGLMSKVNIKAWKIYNEMVDRMNSMIIQYINGMKVIKAFTRSRASFTDLKKVVDEMADFFINMSRNAEQYYSAMNVAFRTGPLFIVPAGLLFYLNNSVELPTLLLFLLMSLGFARPIYNLMMHGSMAFYQLYMSMGRIDALFSETSLEEPVAPRYPEGHEIAFREVSFSYGALTEKEAETQDGEEQPQTESETPPLVLDNISFTIPAGSVAALVGPSGTGKTTIARLIPRFWDVDAGSIEIGGVDIRQMNTTELMDTISFVFQDVFLFNDTIYENIRVGNPDATRDQIIAAAKLARCDDFIEEHGGYDFVVGENGARLSGGERQRLSIARAILKNAPIIVLDEATAFVDPENEGLIQEALAALMASNPESPKTLVVVAHRLSTITEVDQILLVDEGEIAASGTHEELLAANDLYRTLWKSHTDAREWQFDSDADVETLLVNPNTAYEGEYIPLKNPFEPLKTAATHWQRVRALIADQLPLFRRGALWTYLEGSFMALPGLVIFLALVALFRGSISPGVIVAFAIGLIAIFICQYFLNKSAYIAFMSLDANMHRGLRVTLSDYLRRLPLGFFTKRDVGYIDALFTTTIDFLETRLTVALFIYSVVVPALTFIFALFIDWRMALAMGSSVPFAMWVLQRSMGIFTQVWLEQREALKTANARMVEYIQGIGVIRAFNLPGDRFEQFDQAMDRYRHAACNTVTRISPAMIGFSTILEFGFGLMLALGGWLSVNGALDFERFMLFMLIGTSFYVPMMALGDMMSFQRVTANGVDNINEFLKTPLLPESAVSAPPDGYAIEFKAVHFSYEEEKVLDGVSFSIPEKTMVALVGPSGSGKTTITNLIARFWDVDQGAVQVGGVDVREMSSDALLSQITMVFQDVYLFNDTIMNNIRFANPAATDEQVFAAARLAQAHDFIVAMPDGYSSMVGEGGSTLSGGEKQRISIARAILKDAPIVLLDEATASVDPENERLIQQAINALVKQKTVIIIAHRLSTVQTADMILVLKSGQVIEQGTHDELIRHDGLYNYFWQERQKARSWKLGSAENATTAGVLVGEAT